MPPVESIINYRPKDAMRAGGFGRTKLYELIALGKIEARKLGSATLIDAASLHRFIASLPMMESKSPAAAPPADVQLAA